MADTFKFVQTQPYTLAGAGAIAGATTLILKSFQDIEGVNLVMTDFGSIGYGTIEPGNGSQEEQISFTGVTQNANGTATLTGVKTVLFKSPYTETSGLAKTHAGSTTFVISNTAGFYNSITGKNNDETITGTWTFTSPNYPRIDSAVNPPVDDEQFATKKYADDLAIAGSPVSSTSVIGIVKVSYAPLASTNPIAVADTDPRVPTQGENDALVGNGGTPGSSNTYVTQDGFSTILDTTLQYFGDGTDGSAVLDGVNTVSWATLVGSTYTMTSSPRLVNLTIDAGIVLQPAGYIVIGNGTLTNNGTIRNNGGDGGVGGNGANGSNGGTGGTAGAAASGATLTAGTAGQVGGTGAAFNGSGITGGVAGTNKTSVGSDGVAGGTGGGTANGAAGGTNTTETLQVLASLVYPTTLSAGTTTLYNRAYGTTSTNGQALSTSAGSASGGGGASGTNNSAGGGGGGSGSTGGCIEVIFKTIVNGATGIVQANGGNGGNGGNGSNAGTSSGGGGGGGGNGGTVVLVYSSLTDSGTIQAVGGSVGTGGTPGPSGTAGSNGTAGTAGKIFKVVI